MQDAKTIPLREVLPFWFAVSSPLIGVVMGLFGGVVCYLAKRLTITGGKVHRRITTLARLIKGPAISTDVTYSMY